MRYNLAIDEFWAGHPAEARRLIRDNIEFGGISTDAASEQVVLGAASSLLGDHEAAGAAFALARTMVLRGSRTESEADLLWNLAVEAARLGDLEDARADIDAGLRLVRPADHELRILMIATAMRIEADMAQRARISGDVAVVRAAIDSSEAYARDGLSLRTSGTTGVGSGTTGPRPR